MLQDFFISRLQCLPWNKTTYFQQVTLQELQWTFCAHFSLDISFPDMAKSNGHQDHPTYRCVIFYLWGHLKSVVYSAPSPRTTQELKLRIHEEIARIPADVLRRAMSSFHDRLAECEQLNGGHLEDVIFRVEWRVMFFFNVLCYVSIPLIHLFLQMLKYVLPYKCNCIMISNTFHFF